MISIITITFNNYEELLKTVESVPRNAFLEHVVINGGECQKTKEYLQQHKDLISTSEKDKGISDAFNKGIRLATQKYVMFLNSGDVLIDSSYLDFAHQEILTNPQLDYVTSDIIFRDLEVGDFYPSFDINSMNLIYRGMPFPHPGLILKKEIIENVGFFDLSFKVAMDYDLVCRIKRQYILIKGSKFKGKAILMEGGGVSSNYTNALSEVREVLIKNGYYTKMAKMNILQRKLILNLKSLLPYKLKLFLKKIKHRKFFNSKHIV